MMLSAPVILPALLWLGESAIGTDPSQIKLEKVGHDRQSLTLRGFHYFFHVMHDFEIG